MIHRIKTRTRDNEVPSVAARQNPTNPCTFFLHRKCNAPCVSRPRRLGRGLYWNVRTACAARARSNGSPSGARHAPCAARRPSIFPGRPGARQEAVSCWRTFP
jgi:hypothetical protein